MFGSGLDDAEVDDDEVDDGLDALLVDDGLDALLVGDARARVSSSPRRAPHSSSCCHSHCHRPCHSHSVSAARAADADARSRAPATTPSTETPRPKLPAHDARVGGGARAGERPAVSDGLGFDADLALSVVDLGFDVGAPSDFAFALARALAASSSTTDT